MRPGIIVWQTSAQGQWFVPRIVSVVDESSSERPSLLKHLHGMAFPPPQDYALIHTYSGDVTWMFGLKYTAVCLDASSEPVLFKRERKRKNTLQPAGHFSQVTAQSAMAVCTVT